MVNPALLASVDELGSDELDELMEYAAARRFGAMAISDEQRAILASRRNDTDPANWLTDAEFDGRLDAMTS